MKKLICGYLFLAQSMAVGEMSSAVILSAKSNDPVIKPSPQPISNKCLNF